MYICMYIIYIYIYIYIYIIGIYSSGGGSRRHGAKKKLTSGRSFVLHVHVRTNCPAN